MSVISVENISKQYTLGVAQKQRSLRETLTEGVRGLFQKRETVPESSFWALKDVSFEVAEGDRVGIVGRNGAGKSTLLKLLSRISEPTTGRISLRGRVASLLEVGTGFHPELTGRENIYLNGAVLGMSKAEIARKFDEIVDFSEVERFLDTPVKRYSSGMYVRLAFAVAAHLEPEILVVDEVLAVGDAQFQKKCLGKMEDVSSSGRTVLFVSHQMSSVTTLCNKGIWLVNGQVAMTGDVEEVTSQYMLHGSDRTGEVIFDQPTKSNGFVFKRLTLLNGAGEVTSIQDVRRPIRLQIEYASESTQRNLEISFKVNSAMGEAIFTADRSVSCGKLVEKGSHIAEIEIPALFLVPGTYSIDIAAHVPFVQILAHHQSILSFEIEETGSPRAMYHGQAYGKVLVDFPWREQITSSRII
ncbi:MAG: ABC transporter ATP-binding protein [Anaerolineae bacterium]|nr:ABC transporter ATP-binding protein [Gloeobacterales cyanobacterium ES-bin-313]